MELPYIKLNGCALVCAPVCSALREGWWLATCKLNFYFTLHVHGNKDIKAFRTTRVSKKNQQSRFSMFNNTFTHSFGPPAGPLAGLFIPLSP
jgi:hypothetical protein